ncbi:MAG: vanadium-dependent haloperoxidase [Armatimonadota bacterium]
MGLLKTKGLAWSVMLLVLLMFVSGCGGGSNTNNNLAKEQNEVLIWNNTAMKAAADARMMTPQISRVLAIMHIAMYDAVNAIEHTGQFYKGDITLAPSASKETAVAQAAYRVLTQLFPTQAATFDTQLAASLNWVPDGPAKISGIAVGNEAAESILADRTDDGSQGGMGSPYLGGTAPGQWRPTPPGNMPGMFVSWKDVKPFSMTSGEQFRPGYPPALDSADYTAAFNETATIGAKTSAARTAEQSSIATFWVGMPGSIMEAGLMNLAAQQAVKAKYLSLHQSARLFALLNMALCDSAIAGLDCKYEYSAWRPITAIREAASDGNSNTTADTAWEPYLETPAHPEYISTHSTITRSGAVVLQRFFGTDSFNVTLPSFMNPSVTRSYTRFSQIADEAGISRVYGGIHFRFSNQAGSMLGTQIGENIIDNYLQNN